MGRMVYQEEAESDICKYLSSFGNVYVHMCLGGIARNEKLDSWIQIPVEFVTWTYVEIPSGNV